MADKQKIFSDNRLSDWIPILPLSSLLALILVAFLVYGFFSGSILSFYLSVVFLFYSWTKKMWVAVVMLGIFQTLLLVPLRVIRVFRSDNIEEFQKMIKRKESPEVQLGAIQKNFQVGSRTFSFYLVDFTIQLVTFLTIGRMFLTDFYSSRLDPRLLYSFIPYPDYPIVGTIYKIPHPEVTKSINLGLKSFFIFWLAVLILQVTIWIIFKIRDKYKGIPRKSVGQKVNKYNLGYMAILLFASFYLIRHFPVAFTIGFFVGDVSRPNPTLNTITAVVTFITFLWFGISRIKFKEKKAIEKGVDRDVIEETQKQMFKDSLFTATLVGLGAFFITNQIPSAFELSIFTLEIISMLSPLTLDKAIISGKK